MSKLIDNLLRDVTVGVILYGVYKLGERATASLMEQEGPKKLVNEPKSEIDVIQEMIQEIKRKVNKTRRDKDNLGLLEVKLKQLIKQI